MILTFRMTSKNYTFLWILKQCVDILASLTSFHAKMMELIWSSVHLSGIHLVFSRFYTSDGSCTCNPGFGSATALWVYWVLLKQVILHEGLFDDFTKLWILIGNFKKNKETSCSTCLFKLIHFKFRPDIQHRTQNLIPGTRARAIHHYIHSALSISSKL